MNYIVAVYNLASCNSFRLRDLYMAFKIASEVILSEICKFRRYSCHFGKSVKPNSSNDKYLGVMQR